MQEVDCSEHPAAVLCALLHWLYTGRVVLGSGSSGDDGEAAAAGTSQAQAGQQGPEHKRQRRGQQEHQQASTSKAMAAPGTSSTAAAVVAAASDTPPHVLLVHMLHAATYFGLLALHAACLQCAAVHLSTTTALPWLVYGHQHGEQHPASVTPPGCISDATSSSRTALVLALLLAAAMHAISPIRGHALHTRQPDLGMMACTPTCATPRRCRW
jgi:hypothetical protein